MSEFHNLRAPAHLRLKSLRIYSRQHHTDQSQHHNLLVSDCTCPASGVLDASRPPMPKKPQRVWFRDKLNSGVVNAHANTRALRIEILVAKRAGNEHRTLTAVSLGLWWLGV